MLPSFKNSMCRKCIWSCFLSNLHRTSASVNMARYTALSLPMVAEPAEPCGESGERRAAAGRRVAGYGGGGWWQEGKRMTTG